MAVLDINPAYRDLLADQQLTDAARLVDLPGVIVCGHPRRHVRQVTLPLTPNPSPPGGEGSQIHTPRPLGERGRGEGETLTCFLKREHRVGWRQRLANAWAGFGFVSDSRRERTLLQALQRAGVGCPEWLAAGEDERGQAFLLLRGLNDALDLPTFLRRWGDVAPVWRRRFAQHLGTTLAHLHDAGFQHRDLYAKHILVDPHDLSLHLLDWQRGRHSSFLHWQQRWHDLAALHATLPADLAGPRDRLACLRGYLRATLPRRLPRAAWRESVRRIENQARRLLGRRKVREQRQTTVAIGAQRLLWLDGEQLCVTPEFLEGSGGRQPPVASLGARVWQQGADAPRSPSD